MSEVMVSEGIIESYWLLKDYWTRVRFAYQTENGGWSDIDVVAYDPETRHLVIAESKVRGPKKAIYAYTELTQDKYGSLLDYDGNNYFSFLKNLPRICSDGILFKNFSRMVDKITVQLVSNYVIDQDVMEDAKAAVLAQVKSILPKMKCELEVMLNSTMDIMVQVIEQENEMTKGRRYGNAMLDIAREMNRYAHPDIKYAGRGDKEALRAQMISPLIDTLKRK
ncbi:hypothetical protein ORL23_16705 [Kluyvera cryocrescens]|uniref:hypothetical protein n=1 Tax=Kluyvera cryocrescens TaxID=580 RepID=UPI000773A2EB|nr:hypothetical protein [Kluyvera cryocrescens]MCX2869126.1 hypothetical protein [Kluyvera cryocrescens]MEB6634904.1 hypothetical protein [Kluyvera cryocrescens]